MELTVAWFPILKMVIAVALIVMNVYLYKKGMKKTGIAVTVVILVIAWFIPVRYDGTNTSSNHKRTEQARTIEYKNVDRVIVTTIKPTFAERMEAERARSNEANQKVYDEIVK